MNSYDMILEEKQTVTGLFFILPGTDTQKQSVSAGERRK